ncbi:hypothetical protein PVL29_004776 [Vitis rotundifolia]|uniref:Uncharacterized protein n=1 Tax=Vitis rotundifolia TaxID=103349 RepID=A0AA39A8V5_VITRO|nr:hypothetical protein PVL29_004776 [Vitis rotundifolia]
MAEMSSTPDVNRRGMLQVVKEDEETMATPDVQDAAMKIERAMEVYKSYGGFEEEPTKLEVFTWYLYAMCSYFINTVLIPIVFPLFISEIRSDESETPSGFFKNSRGLTCSLREMDLYYGLTNSTITVNGSGFSPFEWTSISWGVGLILACPILGFIAKHLDHGQNQQLVAATATAIGAVFCLPSGFFKTKWIFPPYIAAIVAAYTVCTASHTRHLGLMIRGFTGHPINKSQFSDRRGVAGWLSVHATSAGCLGAAIISTFTYHMLYPSEKFISLWIVSIFSGLIWLIGIFHIFLVNRPAPITALSATYSTTPHVVSIFKYPHAIGSLFGVFLGSFSTMCIFAAAVLHAVGQLCLIPLHLLHLWLLYFLVPLISLPLLQPLQKVLKADAVKMQLLGLLLSVTTAGFGFYYQEKNWSRGHIMFFAALQSTAAGLLHTFGRVLLLDCSPYGKEGAFSVWYSWVREIGTCVGFAVATAIPGKIGKSLGTAFIMSVVAILVLIFGNISSFGGAEAAGHLREESVKGSPVHGLDSTDMKPLQVETP